MSALLSLRKFLAPEFIFGQESRLLVGQYAKNFGLKNVLLVSDSGLMEQGWPQEIQEVLEENGIKHHLFADVSPNPRDFQVMEGAKVYEELSCDGIISVGGGSPMDCAKGIGIVVANGGHILDYEGVDKVKKPIPPLIFIPSTAGTSSDVSQFSIIMDSNEKRKIAIVNRNIMPDLALIDPELTFTMDDYLTACTGIDAMVHAIEAFVSLAHSPMTDLHALEAIRLLSVYLPQAHLHPDDKIIRAQVMFGSLQAGLAFSNAILGAVHSMAHSLGGHLDLAHGECNALLLEHVLNFNFSAAPDRFLQISEIVGLRPHLYNEKEQQKNLVRYFRDLRTSLGITKSLSEKGVKLADIPVLARKAKKDACLLTNPREANERDIEVIYEEAL